MAELDPAMTKNRNMATIGRCGAEVYALAAVSEGGEPNFRSHRHFLAQNGNDGYHRGDDALYYCKPRDWRDDTDNASPRRRLQPERAPAIRGEIFYSKRP
jgi:hypothetical protein